MYLFKYLFSPVHQKKSIEATSQEIEVFSIEEVADHWEEKGEEIKTAPPLEERRSRRGVAAAVSKSLK